MSNLAYPAALRSLETDARGWLLLHQALCLPLPITHHPSPNRDRLPRVVNRDIHYVRLGHQHHFMVYPSALRFDRYADGDRRVANFQGLGIEADEVAHENRCDELDLVHGNGRQRPLRMLARFHRTSLVVCGSTLGILAADGLAIAFGERLTRRIPMAWMRRMASLLFALFGLLILFSFG